MATPVANAKADAEWPDGNDVERVIATWRATGTPGCRGPVVGGGRAASDNVHDRREPDGRETVDSGSPAGCAAAGGEERGAGEP